MASKMGSTEDSWAIGESTRHARAGMAEDAYVAATGCRAVGVAAATTGARQAFPDRAGL